MKVINGGADRLPAVAGNRVNNRGSDVILFIAPTVVHGCSQPTGRPFADRSHGRVVYPGGVTPAWGRSPGGR